jgi:uncharacterized surface anchored protein
VHGYQTRQSSKDVDRARYASGPSKVRCHPVACWVRAALVMLLSVSMQGAGSEVQGIVDLLLSDGETVSPIFDARVFLFSIQTIKETKSDREGKFTFTDVAPGNYRLSAKADGFISVTSSNTFDVRPEQQSPLAVSLRFTKFQNCADVYQTSYDKARPAKRTHIDIEVLNYSTKKPVVGAAVQIQQSDGSSRLSRTTDHRGKVSLSDLNPGSYLVMTSGNGFHKEEATVWLPMNNRAHLKQFLISTRGIFVCQ